MGLLRLLILAALAWFGYRLVRQMLANQPPARVRPTRPQATAADPEPMQRCAHCGVHVPVGESTRSRGHLFCGEAHRDAYFREHPQP